MKKILLLILLLTCSYAQCQHVLMTRRTHFRTSDTWTANNATLSALDSNLEAGWQFSSGSETTDSVNSHTLTAYNTPTYSDTTGKNGQYATLNGSTQYFTAADSSSWDFGSGDFTISTWIYNDAVEGEGVWEHYENDANWFAIYFNLSGYPRVRYMVSSSYVVEINATATMASGWHHIVLTRISSTFTLYVDAVADGTDTYAGTLPDLSGTFRLGRVTGTVPDLYFDGRYDEAMVWKGHGMSSGEVTALYNTGTGAFYIAP